MVRIEAVCACVLVVGAYGALGAHAQDVERDGPGPVNSTQSISAGADMDIRQKAGTDREPENAAAMGHSSGTYAGVVPGKAKPAVPPKAPNAKAPLTITWPGFQMQPDGSSRVFIQSNKPLEPKVLKSPDGKFELELPGAHIAAKTNRLPLDTRFFNTPVKKVSVNAARSGAIVQLDLRATVTPQITSEQGPAGYYFTYIELPKGEYVKQPTAGVSVASGASADATAGNSATVMPTLQPTRPASKVIGKPTSASMSKSGHGGGTISLGSSGGIIGESWGGEASGSAATSDSSE
ncbi:MAG TPA: AMIN domain-containing protein [Polyangiales bacterium]|nr:AMIN domain-containing protein [Polyangiales bacterium]